MRHLAAIKVAMGVATTADESRDGVGVIERQIGKVTPETKGGEGLPLSPVAACSNLENKAGPARTTGPVRS